MKISVVVPVYNAERSIRGTLESVAAQTLSEWECVCVDDGSTDGSAAILDEWAEKDGRFRVVHQPNAGVSAARNRGLELATGDYLWFVDGDDLVSDDSLGVLGDAVEVNGRPDIVHFDLKEFRKGETFSAQGEGEGHVEVYDLSRRDELRVAFAVRAQWLLGSSAIYRRDVYGGDRFAAFGNCEDSLWGRRAFYGARRLVYVNRALYGYRKREDGANNVWTRRRLRDYRRVSWIMMKEGLRVKGIRGPVLFAWLRSVRHAWIYSKRIVD